MGARHVVDDLSFLGETLNNRVRNGVRVCSHTQHGLAMRTHCDKTRQHGAGKPIAKWAWFQEHIDYHLFTLWALTGHHGPDRLLTQSFDRHNGRCESCS
jgi:hypothetical protein